MASRCGFNLDVTSRETALPELFSEELGLVLEIDPQSRDHVAQICHTHELPLSRIGMPLEDNSCRIRTGNRGLFRSSIEQLRELWENTSFELEKLQMDPKCAEEEYAGHKTRFPGIDLAPSYKLTFTPSETTRGVLVNSNSNPDVAIIREEGTNGDREMQAACKAAGLEPWDVSMNDLLKGKISLEGFSGIIFAGGFSYMDVFGSAKGWAGTILFNDKLRDMFDRFYARENTFSLGVCNGCQLMALLGWVPWRGIADEWQPRFVHNLSGRFESRWVQVEVLQSPSILFKGMVGSKLGAWIAHGEGRYICPSPTIHQKIIEAKLAPLAYLDPFGNRTEQYPFNPNGSPLGITALCSPDGRHTAMMPHGIERCFRLWQWPWMPTSWKKLEASPWMRPLQNARAWLLENS